MTYLYNNVFYQKCLIAQPYKVITPAANLAISLANVKDHLRLDPSDSSQDSYLTILIKSAINFGENYTKRTFINTTFLTYLSDFCDCIELRRSKVSSVSFIKYLKNSVLTLVDSTLYYLTDEIGFSHILLVDQKTYPTDVDVNAQAVQIQFVAGYGADDTYIPDEIKLALLNHISAMYENRGDASSDSSSATKMYLPQLSKEIYDQFRIEDIGHGATCCY